jgi:ATP-binding cassette, subfamily B, bacterial MsbA
MKTYFRLLSFAKPLSNFAIPFFGLSILGVIFGLLNFTLLIPLFELLFNETKDIANKASLVSPHFTFSIDYFKSFFYYFFNSIIAESGKQKALLTVCLIIVASIIMSNFFKYMSARVIENFRLLIATRIRSQIFKSLIDIDILFFNTQRKGDLMSRIMTDVGIIQQSIITSMQVILREPITILFNFAVLIAISPQLTLFAIILIPVSGILITTIVKQLKKHARAAQESLGSLVSNIDEGLNGVKIIKAFNAESYIQQKFDSVSFHASKIHRRFARRQLLASPVSEIFGVITVAILLYYGGSLVLKTESNLSGAAFIGYIIIFSQIISPAKAISEAFGTISQGIASGERVFYLIDAPVTIRDAENPILKTAFESDIELKNVSFAYGAKEVLHDVSFKVGKGQTVALVGPSGGGKTTLLDLIPRFIDPKNGGILVDGINIKDLSMHSLRSMMGIVNQESILFNDTIFNNIAFGRNVTKAEVEDAARIANAHEFIQQTEQAYETNIGDRGMKLSGGQKQRICIARAVLGNPPVLLLDEATSALDTESEKLVQEALVRLMENRTSIVIAHRLSTIQNADLIVVIADGKIKEIGTHEDLISHTGLYKRLTQMQSIAE